MPRALVVAAVGLWLAGCTASNDTSDPFGLKTAGAADPFAPGAGTQANAMAEPNGKMSPLLGAPTEDDPALLGADPTDDLSIGKKYYRAGNFGMAERYFRRAVELHARDGEAWLDLAASYDRLRRFDLADRAYAQTTGILGPTAEVLNNQGYSYMLRGDYARARTTLTTAQRKDPSNRFVANNLQLLATSASTGKAIE